MRMCYQNREEDKVSHQVKYFQKNWDEAFRKNKKQIRESDYELERPNILGGVLVKTYRTELTVCFFLAICFSMLQYGNSLIMYYSLKAVNTTDEHGVRHFNIKAIAYLLSALITSRILLSIFSRQMTFQLNLLGVVVRNVLRSEILRKAMKKSIQREQEFTMGELVNLNNTDTLKFSLLGQNGINLLVCPIEIVMGITILWWMVGIAVFPALFCVFSL